MAWFVYVLKSEVDGRLYKGMTEDTVLRLSLHNKGKVSSTKAYRPWRLVYTEECKDSLHARQREKFLWTRKILLEIIKSLTTDQKSRGFLPACK